MAPVGGNGGNTGDSRGSGPPEADTGSGDSDSPAARTLPPSVVRVDPVSDDRDAFVFDVGDVLSAVGVDPTTARMGLLESGDTRLVVFGGEDVIDTAGETAGAVESVEGDGPAGQRVVSAGVVESLFGVDRESVDVSDPPLFGWDSVTIDGSEVVVLYPVGRPRQAEGHIVERRVSPAGGLGREADAETDVDQLAETVDQPIGFDGVVRESVAETLLSAGGEVVVEPAEAAVNTTEPEAIDRLLILRTAYAFDQERRKPALSGC